MDENEKKPSGEALSLDQLGEVTGGGDWGRHCPKCGTATRLAHKVEGDTKTRVCKHCGASY